MAELTRPHPEPTGYQFWHGAQGWENVIEIRPCRKNSYEHGPGLYLTTSLHTAKHYGKGKGCLVELELAPTTRWLEDSTLPMAEVQAFLKDRAGLRRRPEILADLDRHLRQLRERDPTATRIRATVLVNLCVNHEALTADHGPALARFLVDQGIDASRAQEKYSESWVVLFNPAVVTRKVRHRIATVDPHADFPTLPTQIERLAAPSVAPVPEASPPSSCPRPRRRP